MTPRACALCEWLRDYAESRLNSAVMDDRRCIPPHVVIDLGNRGLLGVAAAAEYGGGELALPEILAVFEQLGAIDLTLAIFVGIHNGLGIRPIQRFGSAALRAELLPALATGRMLGAFAMTEPAAGSNARAIETLAVAAGDGWRVRGTKIWVGNGSWAGAINVIARRPPDEGGGTCAFAVRATAPGLRMGAEALTTGMRAIVQNELVLDGVAVARGDLLGAAGDGFAVAEDSFGIARIGIAAIALGGLRRCIQLAERYARRRRISTGPLLANAHARDVLGELVASAAGAAALLQHAGERADATGSPPPALAAICKIVVPELLWRGVDRATQLVGGRAYIEPNAFPQLMRDARLLRIFEGPTEALAAHLGAAALAGALPGILDGIEAPIARARLDDAIAAHAAALAAGSGDALLAAGHRAKPAVGHAIAWGLVAALAEQRAVTAPTDPLCELAARWAQSRLAEQLASSPPAAPDAETLQRAIAAYRDRIGDLEQALPGADHAVDPLLRRGDR